MCAMPKLLLNLRRATDDEADDVRALLDAQHIAFYETTPNLWGISAGGIWVTEVYLAPGFEHTALLGDK